MACTHDPGAGKQRQASLQLTGQPAMPNQQASGSTRGLLSESKRVGDRGRHLISISGPSCTCPHTHVHPHTNDIGVE